MVDDTGVDGVDGVWLGHRGGYIFFQVKCGWGGELDLGSIEDIGDDGQVAICLVMCEYGGRECVEVGRT